MAPEPEVGDKVTWPWGGGAPGGKVAEKKTEGEIAITSKRGNKIKKNADKSDPAVHIERSGNDVVKKASEVNIEQKNSKGGKAGGEKKDDKKDSKKDDKKRKHEDESKAEGDDKSKEPLVKNDEGKDVKPGGKDASKKQKKDKEDKEDKEDKKKDSEEKTESKKEEDSKASGGEKKKAGRPKKSESETKQPKKSTPRQEGDLVSSRTRSRK